MLKTRSNLGINESADRPAVALWIGPGVTDLMRDSVLEGMEEEGIPALTSQTAGADAILLAHQAAASSRLEVGVALLADPVQAVLHHRELPAENPLAFFKGQNLGNQELRLLGANAARLVKGDPLLEEVPDFSFDHKGELPVSVQRQTERQLRVDDLVKRVLDLLAAQQT